MFETRRRLAPNAGSTKGLPTARSGSGAGVITRVGSVRPRDAGNVTFRVTVGVEGTDAGLGVNAEVAATDGSGVAVEIGMTCGDVSVGATAGVATANGVGVVIMRVATGCSCVATCEGIWVGPGVGRTNIVVGGAGIGIAVDVEVGRDVAGVCASTVT